MKEVGRLTLENGSLLVTRLNLLWNPGKYKAQYSEPSVPLWYADHRMSNVAKVWVEVCDIKSPTLL